MRSFRWVFWGVGFALAMLAGLLVKHAHDGIVRERALEHRAVALRLFDEMERELSAFLAREENRPFGHYRHLFVPAEGVAAAWGLTRSPLADVPQHPWVTGYFQLDRDGRFRTPLMPQSD